MLKKITSIFLIVVLALSVMVCAAADDVIELTIDNPQAFVNGVAQSIDPDNSAVTPIIRNDRTLVPVRFIAENLGMEVDWDAENRRVTLTGNEKEILLTIDSSWAEVNGKTDVLDVEPIIYAERTYLPLRFISENLDKKVTWDDATRKITIAPKPPVNASQDAFNGLTFRPVFSEGFAGSSLDLNSGFGMSIDSSVGSFIYGNPDNFMGAEIIKGFPIPTETDGITYTLLAEKEFGNEKLALISAKSEIILGEGVTMVGDPEITSTSIVYLAIDKETNYFVYASAAGDTQEALGSLNSLLESYK